MNKFRYFHSWQLSQRKLTRIQWIHKSWRRVMKSYETSTQVKTTRMIVSQYDWFNWIKECRYHFHLLYQVQKNFCARIRAGMNASSKNIAPKVECRNLSTFPLLTHFTMTNAINSASWLRIDIKPLKPCLIVFSTLMCKFIKIPLLSFDYSEWPQNEDNYSMDWK